jgi:short-subunit dehydrogenase
MTKLDSKVVMITGGSKGLGFVIAKQLVKENCRLALCARDMEELMDAREEIKKAGGNALISVCDVSDKHAVDVFVQKVIRHFGEIDIVVNDAGIIMVGAMESFSMHEYEEAMNVMYWGIVNTTLSVLPHMKERKQGQIVNITSVGGKVSIPHLLPYSAAKFAAIGFSEGVAAELRKDHIYVTTIIPGLMRTGSYVNALFQRDNKTEFKLFSLMSTAPLITISAEKAARLTIKAIKSKQVEKVLGLPAKAIIEIHHFFPETSIKLFGFFAKYIPSAKEHTDFVKGQFIHDKFHDAELPGFEQIGNFIKHKHQPTLTKRT